MRILILARAIGSFIISTRELGPKKDLKVIRKVCIC